MGDLFTPVKFDSPKPNKDPIFDVPSTPVREPLFSFSVDPETDVSREESMAELVGDLLADQLDPLNLLMLASGYGIAAKIGKAIPIVAQTGATLSRTGGKVFGTSVGRRFARHAAQSLGWSLPFASVEFFEEPDEEGGSRVGEFIDSLLVFSVFDAAFLGAAGILGRLAHGFKGFERRFAPEAAAATFNSAVESALSKGFSKREATDLALADILHGKIEAMEQTLGKEMTLDVLSAARSLVGTPGEQRVAQGLNAAYKTLVRNPQTLQRFAQAGIPEEALLRVPAQLRSEILDDLSESIIKNLDDGVKREARRAELRGQLRLDPQKGRAAFVVEREGGKKVVRSLLDLDALSRGEIVFTPAAQLHYSQADLDLLAPTLARSFRPLNERLGGFGLRGGASLPPDTFSSARAEFASILRPRTAKGQAREERELAEGFRGALSESRSAAARERREQKGLEKGAREAFKLSAQARKLGLEIKKTLRDERGRFVKGSGAPRKGQRGFITAPLTGSLIGSSGGALAGLETGTDENGIPQYDFGQIAKLAVGGAIVGLAAGGSVPKIASLLRNAHSSLAKGLAMIQEGATANRAMKNLGHAVMEPNMSHGTAGRLRGALKDYEITLRDAPVAAQTVEEELKTTFGRAVTERFVSRELEHLAGSTTAGPVGRYSRRTLAQERLGKEVDRIGSTAPPQVNKALDKAVKGNLTDQELIEFAAESMKPGPRSLADDKAALRGTLDDILRNRGEFSQEKRARLIDGIMEEAEKRLTKKGPEPAVLQVFEGNTEAEKAMIAAQTAEALYDESPKDAVGFLRDVLNFLQESEPRDLNALNRSFDGFLEELKIEMRHSPLLEDLERLIREIFGDIGGLEIR